MTRRLLVTLSRGAIPGLEAALADLPLLVRRHPLLDVTPVAPAPSLAARLAGTAWGAVVVTSPRGATALRDAGVIPSAPVWCAGPRSAEPLAPLGWPLEIGDGGDPSRGAAQALVERMLGARVHGPVLLVTGDPHRPELPARLADAGIAVDTAVVYRTRPVADVELVAALSRADLLLLGSPALATALARQGDDALLPLYVALGASTAEAGRGAGLPVVEVADEPAPSAVADAVRRAARHLSFAS